MIAVHFLGLYTTYFGKYFPLKVLLIEFCMSSDSRSYRLLIFVIYYCVAQSPMYTSLKLHESREALDYFRPCENAALSISFLSLKKID